MSKMEFVPKTPQQLIDEELALQQERRIARTRRDGSELEVEARLRMCQNYLIAELTAFYRAHKDCRFD